MKYKVLNKQNNSRMCLVCGTKNDLSLKTSFYELENGEIVSIFTTKEEHQSYPGRLHGGITAAILDETIGRAIMIKNKEIWGVTIELNVVYKKPIPLDAELKAVGRIIKENRRMFEGTGELLLPNGDIAATAHGRYLKMPIDKISDASDDEMEWRLVQSPEDPTEIDI